MQQASGTGLSGQAIASFSESANADTLAAGAGAAGSSVVSPSSVVGSTVRTPGVSSSADSPMLAVKIENRPSTHQKRVRSRFSFRLSGSRYTTCPTLLVK